MSEKKKRPAPAKPPPTGSTSPKVSLVLVGADYPDATLVQQIVRSTHLLGRPFRRLYIRWLKGKGFRVTFEFDKEEIKTGSYLVVDATTQELHGLIRGSRILVSNKKVFLERRMCTLYDMAQT